MADPQDITNIIDNCAKAKATFVTSIDAWVACGFTDDSILAVLKYARDKGVTVQVMPTILPRPASEHDLPTGVLNPCAGWGGAGVNQPIDSDLFDVYLDDMRPAPDGWKLVKNIEDVKALLITNQVEHLSLDHDLGACSDCMNGRTPDQWIAEFNGMSMPNCEHVGTGYDLVCWMEETGHWPRQRPVTHTANPAGRMRMRAAIEKHYGS